MKNPSDSEIKKLLAESKTIAVIGLSPVPSRPSYGVTRYMISHGYKIFGVRPAAPEQILGRPCVESLAQLSEQIDIVNVFRNSDAIPEIVDEIKAWMDAGKETPRALWLQEGVEHSEAEARASQLGLMVVSDRCILKEHARLS